MPGPQPPALNLRFTPPLFATDGDGVVVIVRPEEALSYLEWLLEADPESDTLNGAREGIRLALATREPTDMAVARERTGWALLEAGILIA